MTWNDTHGETLSHKCDVRHCASTDGARRAQNCALHTSVCFVVSVPLFAMWSRLRFAVCRSHMFVNMRCRIHSLYTLCVVVSGVLCVCVSVGVCDGVCAESVCGMCVLCFGVVVCCAVSLCVVLVLVLVCNVWCVVSVVQMIKNTPCLSRVVPTCS